MDSAVLRGSKAAGSIEIYEHFEDKCCQPLHETRWCSVLEMETEGSSDSFKEFIYLPSPRLRSVESPVCHEDGNSAFLRNVGGFLRDCSV
jgi:hypothetical protein